MRPILLASFVLGFWAPWMADALSIPPESPRWKFEGQAEVAEYHQRQAIYLRSGAAGVKDLELRDGVIDVDVAAPAKPAVFGLNRAFFGIEFRGDAKSGSAEWVYLRPHKSGLADALQYTPVLSNAAIWQIYNGPGFTGKIEIPKDEWFHMRLEIAGAQAKLYVEDMQKPCLVISDLKSGNQKGEISLVNLSGPVYFSNFEVRETAAAPWERHEPPMPANVLTKWSLSPDYNALERNLERPLSTGERDGMIWQDVAAEAPGFVVINRYRKSPSVNVTFQSDFSTRLQPQNGMRMVYARTHIASEQDQVKKLNIGYSDDVSVFLNGKILFRGRSAQGFRDPGFLGIVNPENDAVYLPLKKGDNELMLAVSELGGGWGFICSLDDLAR